MTKLFTKGIIDKAVAQYPKGASLDQMIIAKFFNPVGAGTWWLFNLEPDDPMSYAWGFAEIFEFEMGSFCPQDLIDIKLPFGLGIERDMHFKPIPAWQLWKEKTGLDWCKEDELEEELEES